MNRTEERKPRLFLLDGTALVYRAHFAFLRNPMMNRRGEVVSAVFGFANALFQILRQEKPEYLGVAFDRGEPTFRHERYAAYKANRPPMPEELIPQLPRVQQLVAAAGLTGLQREGVEADDLIGTMARHAVDAGCDVVIVSGDKDFMQLIGPGVRQWIPPTAGGEGQWIDAPEVVAKWGVDPGQMIDLLALMGDASDNVPGVQGVGPKTAAQLLQQYGSLDAVYAHLEELGKKAVRARLEQDRENAYLSRELVTIRTDLDPLPCALSDLVVAPVTARPELIALLQELEFRRLLETLGPSASTGWQAEYAALGSLDELDRWLERWKASGLPLAIDTETDSLDARTARAVGLTLAWEAGRAAYLPIGHVDGPNLDAGGVVERLGPILSDPAVTLIGQNLKFDLHVLAGLGLTARGRLEDTLLAAYLVDPEGRHSLDALSEVQLGHRMIPIKDLIGEKRDQITMDRVDVARVAEYSGEDVDVTLRLHPLLLQQLDQLGLRALWSDLECPLVQVLLRMEQAGVKVDTELLGALSTVMAVDLRRLEQEIHAAAGEEFNVAAPRQLERILFDRLGLPAKRKTKTARSTDQEVLEELASLHPVPRLTLEHRELAKLKGTYLDALPKLVDPRTGRIHAGFHQMVAATGRLSSSDPNLQNIPVRTPRGRAIRQAFIAAEGCRLVSADYSQIELRVLAHLSHDAGLLEAFATGTDVHAATAERIFGVPAAKVDPGLRARAKTVNFGVIYGMGASRLARELSIPLSEARAFIEAYFAKMPGVRGYLEGVQQQAKRDGFVTTIFGRRRPLPGLASGDARLRAQSERIAANTPIQGSAADLIKRAMLRVDQALADRGLAARLILQVHDELVLEAPQKEVPEVEALLREAMEGAASLRVPLKVEVGRGLNWDEAHG